MNEVQYHKNDPSFESHTKVVHFLKTHEKSANVIPVSVTINPSLSNSLQSHHTPTHKTFESNLIKQHKF